MKTKFKVGDEVKILNPEFVKRVGYPLVWTEILTEIKENPKLKEAICLLGLTDSEDIFSHNWKRDEKVFHEFAIGVARATVRFKNFGGNTRSIFTIKREEVANRISQVYSKSICKTGKRFGSSSSIDSYTGEWDYESGGLNDCKTHILLETDFGLIEQIHVEKVDE